MKQFVLIGCLALALLGLTACSGAGTGQAQQEQTGQTAEAAENMDREETASQAQTEYISAVPEEYFAPSDHPGQVVEITYNSRDYTDAARPVIQKTAYVYLPYGYDETDSDTRYDILYLMHGWTMTAGGFFDPTRSGIVPMLDHFILTYGFDQTDAPEYTARLAAEAGIHVDYIAAVQMVDNYLPVFDMAEQMGVDKHVEEQLSAAVQAVSRREHGIPEATEEGRKLHAQVAARNKERPAFNDGSQITVLDSCIGCGVCQPVCPVGNFYLEGEKAKRKQSTCEFCLACIQNCPKKATGLSIADKNSKARYRNPHISLQEIINANGNS